MNNLRKLAELFFSRKSRVPAAELRHTLELAILLIASAFGLLRASQEILISNREKSPTHISVDQWQQYRGQSWLEVEGNLDVERAVIQAATDNINRSEGNVYAYVPIVGSQSTLSDPIHAVAVLGPMPRSQANSILWSRNGWTTVSGEIAPAGVYDTARLMPGKTLDSNVVFVNENTQPTGGAAMWFLFLVTSALFLFCLFIIGLHIRKWLITRREKIIPPEE